MKRLIKDIVRQVGGKKATINVAHRTNVVTSTNLNKEHAHKHASAQQTVHIRQNGEETEGGSD